jgi:pyridoxal phosphate enzyme (YggS family)
MKEENAPPLNICIEINIDGEPNKSGVAPAAAGELASAVSRLPGLALRGLMAMPAPHTAASQQRAAFRKVRELRDAIAGRENLCLDVLSMGMSGDYQAAIQEGATMLRIGTAIFGARATKQAAANGG